MRWNEGSLVSLQECWTAIVIVVAWHLVRHTECGELRIARHGTARRAFGVPRSALGEQVQNGSKWHKVNESYCDLVSANFIQLDASLYDVDVVLPLFNILICNMFIAQVSVYVHE